MLIRHTVILVLAVFLFLTSNSAYSADAIDLMNRGQAALYKGEIIEGIRLLEEARGVDGKNIQVLFYLAKGYSWNSQWEEAKSLYGEVVNLSDKGAHIHWEAKFGIAQVISWEKNYDQALMLYMDILKSYKNIPDSFRLDIGLAIGDIYSWKLENSMAENQFRKLLAEYPDNTVVLNRLGKLKLWTGDYSESRSYTEKVLSIDKRNNEAQGRLKILEQVKPVTVMLGYSYTLYDQDNDKGERIMSHRTVQGINWLYSNPLRFFLYITEVRQNSIESSNPEEASSWNSDANFRAGGIYRFNTLTYMSAGGDYALNGKVFSDFSTDFALSRKMNRNIDLTCLYKFTYDKIDSVQTVDSKKYHMVSPGIVIYYNREIYNRLQLYTESDGRDLSYSMLMHQYFAVDSDNILNFYLFLSQGRNYLVYSDSTILKETTTYSVSLLYTHFYSPGFGMEFSLGLTNSVDNYINYTAGVNFIFKW